MKNVMKKVVLGLTMALTACTLMACGSGNAASANTIKFATNPEFPPFEFITAEGVLGEYDGIDMAIAKKIGEDNGMEAIQKYNAVLVFLITVAAANKHIIGNIVERCTPKAKKHNTTATYIPYFLEVATNAIADITIEHANPCLSPFTP